MIECETRFRVRYAETDQMKIAHHSSYIVWFELARVELLNMLGVTINGLEREGYLIPVLEVFSRYIHPARFGDELTVRAILSEKPRAKIRFDYVIRNADDVVLCEGSSLHGFMNTEYRPVKPPESFRKRVNALF